LCRELAEEPLVDSLVEEVRWDVPLRLLGGLHYLVLAEGADAWSDTRGVLADRGEWLARFVAEQGVQTNEVQRCWALLPAFLSLAERPLSLVELGPSAGLNLLWDRYRYRYAAGEWGDPGSPLALAGEERAPVPAELLARRPEVVARVGIDRDPVDVSTEEGALLLQCFVWPDQTERLERLRRAIEAARESPAPIVRGDFVDELPSVLAEQPAGALTVVYETAAIAYLTEERLGELHRILRGSEQPLAWLGARESQRDDGYEFELALPPAEPRHVASLGFHGQWLEWLG
jgi:hypothetical protein